MLCKGKFLRNILGIDGVKEIGLAIQNSTKSHIKLSGQRKSCLENLDSLATQQDVAPAKIALTEYTREIKKHVGRPSTSLLSVIKTQLQEIKINSFEEAISTAQNRQLWRRLITDYAIQVLRKSTYYYYYYYYYYHHFINLQVINAQYNNDSWIARILYNLLCVYFMILH